MEEARAHGCAKCGLINGELKTCVMCGDVYHNRTCLTAAERGNSRFWRCPQCVSNKNRPFVPSDVINNTEYYSYLDLFTVEEAADGTTNTLPSIVAILLRLEWMLNDQQIPDVAKCVSKYFAARQHASQSDQETTFKSTQTLNYYRMIDGLRLIVGFDEFEMAYNQLVNQEYTISTGLAPSLQFFTRKCSNCSTFRYLRSYCYNCGVLFNVKEDVCIDLDIELHTSSNGSGIHPVKWNTISQLSSSNKSNSNSHKNSKSNYSKAKDNGAIILSKYEQVALRALKRFVSAAEKPYNYQHYGGDIFFLLRNIATSCVDGVIREFAKEQFRMMCARWLEDPPDQLLQDEEPNLEGTVSSCQVIQCLLNEGSLTKAMYCEPDNEKASQYLHKLMNSNKNVSSNSLNNGSEESDRKRSKYDREFQINRVKNAEANSVAPFSFKNDSINNSYDENDVVCCDDIIDDSNARMEVVVEEGGVNESNVTTTTTTITTTTIETIDNSASSPPVISSSSAGTLSVVPTILQERSQYMNISSGKRRSLGSTSISAPSIIETKKLNSGRITNKKRQKIAKQLIYQDDNEEFELTQEEADLIAADYYEAAQKQTLRELKEQKMKIKEEKLEQAKSINAEVPVDEMPVVQPMENVQEVQTEQVQPEEVAMSDDIFNNENHNNFDDVTMINDSIVEEAHPVIQDVPAVQKVVEDKVEINQNVEPLVSSPVKSTATPSKVANNEIIDLTEDYPFPVASTFVLKRMGRPTKALKPKTVTIKTPKLKQTVQILSIKSKPQVTEPVLETSKVTSNETVEIVEDTTVVDTMEEQEQVVPEVSLATSSVSPEPKKGMIVIDSDDAMSLASVSDDDVLAAKGKKLDKPKASVNKSKQEAKEPTLRAKRKEEVVLLESDSENEDEDDDAQDMNFLFADDPSFDDEQSEPSDHTEDVETEGMERRSLRSSRSSVTQDRVTPRLKSSGSGIFPVSNYKALLESASTMTTFSTKLNTIKDQILVYINALSIIEILNVDPNEKGVPMTPIWHCQHCGANSIHNGNLGKRLTNGNNNNNGRSNGKGSSNSKSKSHKKKPEPSSEEDDKDEFRICEGENGKSCGIRIVPAIDYASLTESLCWSYLHQCLGIDVDIKNTSKKGEGVYINSISKIVRQLPLMRSYSSLGELGSQFYSHQCYFVTHLIFVFSDYGQHTLRRQLFAEEFYFIVTQMKTVIHSLQDPEITGEFISCLNILQYSEENDPELVEIVTEAKEFLVQRENDLGQVGKFLSSSLVKFQYHASYCGVIGLMDSTFTKDVEAARNPPIPNVLSMLQ